MSLAVSASTPHGQSIRVRFFRDKCVFQTSVSGNEHQNSRKKVSSSRKKKSNSRKSRKVIQTNFLEPTWSHHWLQTVWQMQGHWEIRCNSCNSWNSELYSKARNARNFSEKDDPGPVNVKLVGLRCCRANRSTQYGIPMVEKLLIGGHIPY